MENNKHGFVVFTLFTAMMMFCLNGCKSEWRDDSCHILPEVTVCEQVSSPAAEVKIADNAGCHWLDGFHYLEPPKEWQANAVDIGNLESQQITAKTDIKNRNAPKLSKLTDLHSECIDINMASESELTKLPGVGQGRAKQIIQYREKKSFKKKSDITRIKGIGKKSYHKLSAFICEI